MGVVLGTAALLIEHFGSNPARGRLLQLGRQDIFFSRRALEMLLEKHRFRPANRQQLDALPNLDQPLDDRQFFGIFGFESIEALDYGGFHADIDFDMNAERLPEAWRGRYGAVFDGGTMEHVFHVPNFLANTGDLLAPGGVALHMNPASNSVEHGFYSFSPCLYYEYYLSNKYKLHSCTLIDLGTRLRPIRMRAYSYLPPLARDLLDGYLPGNIHWVWCVAEKTAESTRGAVPQQGFYRGLWEEENAGKRVPAISPAVAAAGPSLISRVKAFIKARPRLENTVRRRTVPVVRMQRILETRWMLRRLGRRIP
jgi:hypothetical protein